MLSPERSLQFAEPASEIVRERQKRLLVKDDALRLEALKPLELRFQQRGMIHLAGSGGFSPLWFVAETERNVFLWRKGLSLSEYDRFEFWVNIELLAEKRIGQLSVSALDNPFRNPSWGIEDECGNDSNRAERLYLSSFLDAFKKIMFHAHALSMAASIAERELSTLRPVVILPSAAGE